MTTYLKNKPVRVTLPLLSLGALAAAISGCGGASLSNSAVVATPDSGPVIYGDNALAQSGTAVTTGATSSLTFTPDMGKQTGAIIGAIHYKTTSGAGPLPAYKFTFKASGTSDAGVPLGFAPGGLYFNTSTNAVAVPTTSAGTLTFGVYVSQGAKGGNLVDINPSSIVLTSPESPAFTLPITFDPNSASDSVSVTQYKTAPFALPTFMQTTGLHDLHATVADVNGQSSNTDFAVPTVAPTDVALFLQSLTVLVPATAKAAATTTTTAITPGDTVTIDGGAGIGVYPTGYVGTLADAQGTVVLFTTPGTHTLTETDSTGAVVQTETFTLNPKTTPGTTLLAPPNPDGAPAAAIRSRVVLPAAKRGIKH